MKKFIRKIIIGIVMLVISIFLITTSKATFTMTMNLSGNSIVKVGEDVIVKIDLSEKIVACNFEISYNKENFQFLGSSTNGLSAAVNGEKVSCIYYDSSLAGTDSLSIKFKAIKETDEESNFTIEDVKFRAKGKDVSYTIDDIIGMNTVLTIGSITDSDSDVGPVTSLKVGSEEKITSSSDKKDTKNIVTTSKTTQNKLPNAGVKENIGYVLMAISILLILSVIFKAKEIELNKIFKAGGLMLVVAITTIASLGTVKTYAAVKPVEIKFYKDILIQNQSNVIIALNNKAKKIKKSEVKSYNSNISDIVKADKTSLADTDDVKTGDILKVGNSEYKVILLGDSNSDGTVCDTDDIMTIINDYIGTNTLTAENRMAANLSNNDNILDTDDLMQMANTYLGQTSQIITTMPVENVDITQNSGSTTTNSKLSDVAELGDKVNYTTSQSNIEWRVWKIDGTNVMIIPTSSIYSGTYKDYKSYWAEYEQYENNLYNGTNESEFVKTEAANFWTAFKSCFNSTYAKQIRLPENEEYDRYKNSTNPNEINIFNTYFKGHYGSIYVNNNRRYGSTRSIDYWNINPDAELDLRPVVVLKDNLSTSGKDSNNAWQLVN